MNKTFSNENHVTCVFTDDGVSFCSEEQEVFMPYGCIDSIKMSLLGILQAVSHVRICSFTVERKDRAEVKEMVKFAQKAMQTASKEEIRIIDLTQKTEADAAVSGLSPEEQLKHYKMLFVQGVISKDEYEARKHQLKKN